jgi:hypothetical protein
MTSKEAFELILKLASSKLYIQNVEAEIQTIYGYPIEKIRNDFKILDLLKELIGRYFIINDDSVEIENYILFQSLPKDKIELLKEWLEK